MAQREATQNEDQTNGNANEELSIYKRKCMRHLLNNLTTSLHGVSSLIERNNQIPSKDEIASVLKNASDRLNYATEALHTDEHCILPESECAYIGCLVGCIKKSK